VVVDEDQVEALQPREPARSLTIPICESSGGDEGSQRGLYIPMLVRGH
jgi:hypothetical protein